MIRTITASAPAKINLTLDVSAPRPDGYHNLDSIVIKVSPADTLTITVSDDVSPSQVQFSTDDATLPKDGGNLVVRAATALLEHTASSYMIKIHLQKRLPIQAGLGGGSSDAATTLKVLAPLLGVSSENVLRIAATIGSDIPLFLTTGIIRIQGKGEVVTALPYRPEIFGVLVRPTVGVPTPDAYRYLDAIPGRISGAATNKLLRVLHVGSNSQDIAAVMHNDFEEPILARYAEIARVSQMLREAGVLRTLLCGSGSAVFGMTEDRETSQRIARDLSGRFPFVSETQVWYE
jgi:4-diphosphocytidyl-2-C-methyl-D-erythritol kinase